MFQEDFLIENCCFNFLLVSMCFLHLFEHLVRFCTLPQVIRSSLGFNEEPFAELREKLPQALCISDPLFSKACYAYKRKSVSYLNDFNHFSYHYELERVEKVELVAASFNGFNTKFPKKQPGERSL